MTSVNATTTKPAAPSSGATVPRAQVADDKKTSEPGGRGVGEMLSGATGKALEIGKDVAQKGVNAIADQAITGAEHTARHAVRASVLNPMSTLYSSMVTLLPFNVGKNLFSGVLNKFFVPYYQQLNPATKITSEQIIHALEHGHTDSLENELFEAFDMFIQANLTQEDRAKYAAGDKKVVVTAFKNLTMSQINTAREPGGIAKICGGIANFIPLVNKLPAVVKPWVGGALATLVAYKLAKLAWGLVKWSIAMFAGVTGLKFLANKFGGGAGAPAGLAPMPAMHGEEASAEGGGFMSKMMKGASRLAEVAAQAQGAGGGGHGAPGGGALNALAALAGGAGGGH